MAAVPGRPGNGLEVIRERVKTLPAAPGVYRMINARGDVLYVGKARDLKKRVSSYTQIYRLDMRLQRMVSETATMEFVATHTEVEALLLEANLIKRYLPRYNVLLRDDKSFPYIAITGDHAIPQITKHRGARNRPGEYFGPFASAGAVNRTIVALQRAFLLRNCSDSMFAMRTRPCLQYQIKRCSAPCVQRISEADYGELVREARDFLTGKSREIQDRLVLEMRAASDALDFERAARLRDRIQALTQIQSRQDINLAGVEEADVIADLAGRRPDLHPGVLLPQPRELRQPRLFPLARQERGTARRAGRLHGPVLREQAAAAPHPGQPRADGMRAAGGGADACAPAPRWRSWRPSAATSARRWTTPCSTPRKR